MKQRIVTITTDCFGPLNDALNNGWVIKEMSAATHHGLGVCFVLLEKEDTKETREINSNAEKSWA